MAWGGCRGVAQVLICGAFLGDIKVFGLREVVQVKIFIAVTYCGSAFYECLSHFYVSSVRTTIANYAEMY